MITNKKITQDGQNYRLVIFNNHQYLIYKDSMVTGKEAEFSKKIAEFKNEKKAMEYWNKIK